MNLRYKIQCLRNSIRRIGLLSALYWFIRNEIFFTAYCEIRVRIWHRQIYALIEERDYKSPHRCLDSIWAADTNIKRLEYMAYVRRCYFPNQYFIIVPMDRAVHYKSQLYDRDSFASRDIRIPSKHLDYGSWKKAGRPYDPEEVLSNVQTSS